MQTWNPPVLVTQTGGSSPSFVWVRHQSGAMIYWTLEQR